MLVVELDVANEGLIHPSGVAGRQGIKLGLQERVHQSYNNSQGDGALDLGAWNNISSPKTMQLPLPPCPLYASVTAPSLYVPTSSAGNREAN